MNTTHDCYRRMRIAHFDYTQPGQGDAGSIAELVKLPGGSVRVTLSFSRVSYAAMGTSRTMGLGWLAYTNDNSAAVVADPNGLDDGVDVAAAGSINPGAPSAETRRISSRAGRV